MQIPVVGMDPSLNNWGLASAKLDLETGFLSTPVLSLVTPAKIKGKQVRVNSQDLHRAHQLADSVRSAVAGARAVFVEVPVGSQSARAMVSYGVCVGILGALRAEGVPLIEVTPHEVKMALSGIKNASKQQMIDAAVQAYPDANFPIYNNMVAQKAEHLADAIGAIHAGANTPVFQQTVQILKGTN